MKGANSFYPRFMTKTTLVFISLSKETTKRHQEMRVSCVRGSQEEEKDEEDTRDPLGNFNREKSPFIWGNWDETPLRSKDYIYSVTSFTSSTASWYISTPVIDHTSFIRLHQPSLLETVSIESCCVDLFSLQEEDWRQQKHKLAWGKNPGQSRLLLNMEVNGCKRFLPFLENVHNGQKVMGCKVFRSLYR